MKPKICLALALAITSPMAFASTTYTYTGNPFDTFISSDGVFQDFSTANAITFQFTTKQAIAPNTTIGSFAAPLNAINAPVPLVTSWSFSDGSHVVDNTNQQAFQFFSLETDATGAISRWYIALMPVSPANGYFMGLIISPDSTSGCVPGIGVCHGVQDYAFSGNTPYAFAGSSSAGTWNTNPTTVPVPAAMWLFASGLGLVSYRRQNRAV